MARSTATLTNFTARNQQTTLPSPCYLLNWVWAQPLETQTKLELEVVKKFIQAITWTRCVHNLVVLSSLKESSSVLSISMHIQTQSKPGPYYASNTKTIQFLIHSTDFYGFKSY